MERDIPSEPRFVICISNDDYEASLEVGKVYRLISDEEAAAHGYLRVIDESGEDYAYSAERFFPIDLPQAVQKALLSVSRAQSPAESALTDRL